MKVKDITNKMDLFQVIELTKDDESFFTGNINDLEKVKEYKELTVKHLTINTMIRYSILNIEVK